MLLLTTTPVVAAAPPAATALDPAGIAFFEAKIRPVLIEHCYKCHSADAAKENKVKGGLLVDSRAALLKGGDTGPSIVPGDAEKSLLIAALKFTSTDLEMPPKGKLPEAVIADFVKWVQMGAPDPREGTAVKAQEFDLKKVRAEHWAFKPLRASATPQAVGWGRTAIDGFIWEKLQAAKVKPAAEADPRVLLRRVYLDLIGLPPTIAEQEAFLKEVSSGSAQSEMAYERVVDDLLSRPQYGERWARHWLDVVRYAETKGYERDEDKPHTWRYRDWVIDALNSDMPYDRFIAEQIAGDEIEGTNSKTQTAMTFLSLGPYDTIANDGARARYDQLDDVMGTAAVAFLGQTIQCARCHDHKFEPLSQEDYYRLLAAFEPLKTSQLEEGRNGRPLGGAGEREEHAKQVAEYEKQYAPLREEFEKLTLSLLEKLQKEGPAKGKPMRLEARHFARVLPALRVASEQRTKEQREQLVKDASRINDALNEFVTGDDAKQYKDLRDKLASHDKQRPAPMLGWVPEESGTKPKTSHVLIRGEANKPGKQVEFGLPRVLESPDLAAVTPTATTSGRRLWLARWMAGDGSALVARVMVNRLWQYHFGQGFVSDANDFGVKADTPTHPQLLDFLAHDFVQGGWKIKRMHRQIVLSSVYRLAASHPDPQSDPDNVLFSRWPVHRLEAEAIRDSILAISGKLNPKMHGPSIHPPFEQKTVGASAATGWSQSDDAEASRRSVYIFQKRAIPFPDLTLLGVPDSSVSCAKRAVSTTPVQSLLLLNGKFADSHAKLLAERLRREAGADRAAQVRFAFSLVLCRLPLDHEQRAAMEFLSDDDRPANDGLAALCLVLMNTNEFVYRN